MARLRAERGQATVEHAGLIVLLALCFAAMLALLGPRLPAGALAGAVADKLLCAVRFDGCERPPREGLEASYGAEVAALVRAHAPEIHFESGPYASLPVDFRSCSLRECADTVRLGAVNRSQGAEPPTAFVRAVDCREGGDGGADADCSGPRGGNLYLQYWLYYPDSATRAYGRKGYHPHDWESYQVRIGRDGEARARASSHKGYNDEDSGLAGALSDAGLVPRSGWGETVGYLHVAAGSHAGRTAPRWGESRLVRRERLRLLALEPIAATGERWGFEPITPPWRKPVWRDPEAKGT